MLLGHYGRMLDLAAQLLEALWPIFVLMGLTDRQREASTLPQR